MATCSCPSDLSSLNQLCESCTAEYLKVLDDAHHDDELARRYGCTPELLGAPITELESNAIAKTNALDFYEPHQRLDIHAHRIADVELRLKTFAKQLTTLTEAVRGLVELAIERRPR